MEGDLTTGCYRIEQRIKDDATPIDNVTKYAWEPSDIIEETVWHEYDEAELAFQRELEESAIRAEFNEQLPATIDAINETHETYAGDTDAALFDLDAAQTAYESDTDAALFDLVDYIAALEGRIQALEGTNG